MRPLLLFGLLAVWALTPALAESIIVTKPWAQVRSRPAAKSKAIAIVYGNDTYEVLDEENGWYKVRTATKVVGWLPAEHVYAVTAPIANKALGFANDLREAGQHDRARAKYFEIVQNFPGTLQAYLATRQLLAYHPVGELPEPVNGKVKPRDRAKAVELFSVLLVQEGLRLTQAKRYDEAVSLFEAARARGRLNRTAMAGMARALIAQLREAEAAKDQEKIRVTKLALQRYFPRFGQPNPPPAGKEDEPLPEKMDKQPTKEEHKPHSADAAPDSRPIYGPDAAPPVEALRRDTEGDGEHSSPAAAEEGTVKRMPPDPGPTGIAATNHPASASLAPVKSATTAAPERVSATVRSQPGTADVTVVKDREPLPAAPVKPAAASAPESASPAAIAAPPPPPPLSALEERPPLSVPPIN